MAIKRLGVEEFQLKNEEFPKLMNNENFRNEIIKVCGDCYHKLINLHGLSRYYFTAKKMQSLYKKKIVY